MTLKPLPVSLEEFDAIAARFALVEDRGISPDVMGTAAHDDRGRLIELVRWWRESHAARVSELLEANNAEVSRRRAAEVELAEVKRKTRGLRARIGHRMNGLLCEVKPDHDDSLTGINAAWDLIREALDEALL